MPAISSPYACGSNIEPILIDPPRWIQGARLCHPLGSFRVARHSLRSFLEADSWGEPLGTRGQTRRSFVGDCNAPKLAFGYLCSTCAPCSAQDQSIFALKWPASWPASD